MYNVFCSVLLVDVMQQLGHDYELLLASHRKVFMDVDSGNILDSGTVSPEDLSRSNSSAMMQSKWLLLKQITRYQVQHHAETTIQTFSIHIVLLISRLSDFSSFIKVHAYAIEIACIYFAMMLSCYNRIYGKMLSSL